MEWKKVRSSAEHPRRLNLIECNYVVFQKEKLGIDILVYDVGEPTALIITFRD